MYLYNLSNVSYIFFIFQNLFKVKIRPLMDGNSQLLFLYFSTLVKIRPLMDGNLIINDLF